MRQHQAWQEGLVQGLRLWAQRQHLQVGDIHCIYQLKEKTL